jgi:hypothetical protein
MWSPICLQSTESSYFNGNKTNAFHTLMPHSHGLSLRFETGGGNSHAPIRGPPPALFRQRGPSIVHRWALPLEAIWFNLDDIYWMLPDLTWAFSSEIRRYIALLARSLPGTDDGDVSKLTAGLLFFENRSRGPGLLCVRRALSWELSCARGCDT